MKFNSQTKVADLRKLAVEAGIPGSEDMEKPELLKALKAYQAENADNDEADEQDDNGNSEDESEDESDEEESEEEEKPEASKVSKPRSSSKVKSEEDETADAMDDWMKTPAPVGSKAQVMRDKLKAQPKVRVFIPLAQGEKQGVTQSVILNGWPLYIRKGEYVNVPESVAEVLEAKLNQKMIVESHPNRVGGDRPVKLDTFGSN